MQHTKPVKQFKLDEVSSLEASIKAASSVVFVDYATLTMKEGQKLKKSLKETGGKMVVSKNTLIKIASKNANLPEEILSDSVLSGQTAMIMANDDPVAPIQTLGKFMVEADKLKWKAGVVEGVFTDAAGLMRISKLPSKDQLIAQVVGGISAPLYGLVSTLNGNLQKLVYILSQKVARG